MFATSVGSASAEGADPRFDIAVTIEIAADGSERLTWNVSAFRSTASGIRIPADAILDEVRGPRGAIPFSLKNGTSQLVEFDDGEDRFTLRAHRAPPNASLFPFHSRGIYIGGYLESRNVIEVQVIAAEPLRLFWTNVGGVATDGRAARVISNGSVDLTYSFEAPLPAGGDTVIIEEGLYRIAGPASFARWIREVAQQATPAAKLAANRIGVALAPPYRVVYAPEDVFDYEEGYYGLDGIIAIRKTHVGGEVRFGHPWSPAETLVHETFHAFSVPAGGSAPTTWWVEGTATEAERLVGGDDGWTTSDGYWIWTFQSQLSASTLNGLYGEGWVFAPNWTNSVMPDAATRARHYEYSGFLVAAYAQRAGQDAYQRAWTEIRAGYAATECVCDPAWLEDILLRNAPNLTAEELYYPYRALRGNDRAGFDALIMPLVANDAVSGTPRPLRPEGIALVNDVYTAVTMPPTVRWSPRIELDEVRRGVGTAAVITFSYDDVAFVERGGPEFADSRPEDDITVLLDGEPIYAVTRLDNQTVEFHASRVAGGTHVLRTGLVRTGTVVTHTFQLDPVREIELRVVSDDTIEGWVFDAANGARLADENLLLYLDGEAQILLRSDVAGYVVHEFASLTPGNHSVGLSLESEEAPRVLGELSAAPALASSSTADVGQTSASGPFSKESAAAIVEARDSEAEAALPWTVALLGVIATALAVGRRRP